MNIMETLQRGLEDDNPVNSKREMAFALSRGCIDRKPSRNTLIQCTDVL